MLNQSLESTLRGEYAIIPSALAFLDRYMTPTDYTTIQDPLFLRAMLEFVLEEPGMVTDEMVDRACRVMSVPTLDELPGLAANPRFVGQLLFFVLTGWPLALSEAWVGEPAVTAHGHWPRAA